MNRLADKVRKKLEEINPEAIFLTGLDSAVIGYRVSPTQCVVVYSRALILDALMVDNNWEYGEAVEWYDFNVKGGCLGEHTPIVLED